MKNDTSSYELLKEVFNLCNVPTGPSDVMSISATLEDSLGTMAMVDYPYPTSFVEPLPAWPVNYACEQAAAAKVANEGENADLYAIAAAGSTFYNYAGQLTCLDTSSEQGGGLDGNGWGVLACNEMVMPFASNPETSIFPASTWNKKEHSATCEATMSEKPQYDWALEYFGGINPTKDFMKASNIIFSNGELDPWQAGGVTFDLNDQTIPI